MATLTIDLDDEATQGIMALNDQLDQTSEAVNGLIAPTINLTRVQMQQLVVIEAQKTNWKDLGVTSVKVLGEISVAGIHCYEAIETSATKAFVSITTTVIKEGASVLKWIIGTKAAVASLGIIFGRNKQDADETADSHSRLADLAVFAGKKISLIYTGLGPQVAAINAGLQIQEALWARTGIRVVELADGTTKLESNLDRVNAASSKAIASVSRDFTEVTGAAKSLLSDALYPIADAWEQLKQEADKSITRDANRVIENIGLVESSWQSLMKGARGYIDLLGLTDRPLQEIVDEQRKIEDQEKKVAEQREKARAGVERVADAEKKLQQLAQNRADSERIANISTVKALDEEIAKTKEKMNALAQAGKLSAARGDKDKLSKEEYEASVKAEEAAVKLVGSFVETINSLEGKRTAVQKKEQDNRRKLREEALANIKAHADETNRIYEEAERAQHAIFDAGTKRLEQQNAIFKALVQESQQQANDTMVAGGKDAHAMAKDQEAARLKAQGANEQQTKSALFDMDKQFAQALHSLKLDQLDDEARQRLRELQTEREINQQIGGTKAERTKRDIELRTEQEKVFGDLQRKRIEEAGKLQRELNQIELNDKKQLEAAKLKAEADRIAKVKQINEDAAKKVDVRALMQQADPTKVLWQLQDNRAKVAQQQQADRDSDLFDRGQAGDKSAMRKFEENARASGNKARRQAFNEFQNGNVKDSEWQKAQADVTEQTLSQFQAQGKINEDTVKVLTDALKTQNDQQTAMDNVQQVLGQLIAAQRGIKQVGKAQANNNQAQMGALW